MATRRLVGVPGEAAGPGRTWPGLAASLAAPAPQEATEGWDGSSCSRAVRPLGPGSGSAQQLGGGRPRPALGAMGWV